jgi:hypothetical protein
MKKKTHTYNVICSNNNTHRFPFVIEVKDSPQEDGTARSMQAYCPMCKDWVNVEVKQEALHDKMIYKSIYGLTDEDLR